MKTAVLRAILLTSLAILPLSFTACATKPKPQTTVNDATLAAKVKSDLLRDPVVNALDIQVTASGGTVQLTGNVATFEQRTRAGEIAAHAPGVVGVQNNITVRTTQ